MDEPVPLGQVLEHQQPLSVAEYHRMMAAGALGDGQDVELLRGLIIARSPQLGPHARVIQRLTGTLVRALGPSYDVRVQLPLTFEDSEPEPDFAVVRHGEEGTGADHPTTALLVIELSRANLSFDRAMKVPMYAQAGVAELWLVDAGSGRVEVRRDPVPAEGRYRVELTVAAGEPLVSESLPNVKLFGRDLLG